MQGTMLWFNRDKGYGFIQTEDEERLYVAHDGFQQGHAPTQRCAGRAVTFERQGLEGDARAVNACFPEAVDHRRARPRHSRGAIG
jgi:cold shock CspA family protein